MGKKRIPEPKLLKALAELQAAAGVEDDEDDDDVAKGDPLEDADPEGGLSTEGEPLSSAAPRGKSTKKSDRRSMPFGGSSSSSSSSSASSDDESSDDGPPRPPKKGAKKGIKKAAKAASSSSSMSSDDESSDDESSDDESSDDASSDHGSDDAEKSFREVADGDETMHKAIVVNEFIESMVDQLSIALSSTAKKIAKSMQAMEERLNGRIDQLGAGVGKSLSGQQAFNARLAKAVAGIGNIVQDDLLGMADLVKSIADQPAPAARGKAVLSKGEVNQPPWGGANADQNIIDGTGDYITELRTLPTSTINDWLFKKSATNQLDMNVVLAFEADKYNPEALPMSVRKALVNDLIK